MSGAIQFSPAHSHPFTLEEAKLLDINILVAGQSSTPSFRTPINQLNHVEISRLRNSVTHLQKTQDELRSFLAEEPGDVDITQAIQENDDTM